MTEFTELGGPEFPELTGFDRIGRGQGTTQGIGILQKGEIVVAFLTQFRHESRIVVVEALAKVFELSATDLFIPSISQRTPTLLELGRIIFGEMVFGIALHVNYAELNISGGKQAFGDGQQTGKIILYDDENTAQAALEQAAQHELPVFQILAAGLGEAGSALVFYHPDPARRPGKYKRA